MSSVDTRQIPRDSLFLLANVQLEGDTQPRRVKVRNLSARGMMAEGDVRAKRGLLVSVELRNVGWVEGSVAWVQDNRFGIAFSDEIDAKRVRLPVSGSSDDHAPRYTRTPMQVFNPPSPDKLRKI
ncbi:pilus assembly protein PilZ [Croceicoccus estronivorus]|uniref:PilZ domain-containing protein n=1 Tax=Croceicoccus estronivorus TaxID=1172626 RepID=UPI000836FB6E|nr:PilZ domain-containing protein [Croceicoccus estronivorus]OCC24260.1 pilus assembly protein PilZ [Croceicoccus estronivorus]